MYDYKGICVLDFRNVKYYLKIHEVIRKELDFPDYYGCNWDAFWDCMTDILGDLIYIRILGLENLDKCFQGTSEELVTLLYRVKHHYGDKYSDTMTFEIIDENGNVTEIK